METTYTIQHVSQTESPFSDDIYFTIDNFPFSIIVFKPDSFRENHEVDAVFHEDGARCPFCKEEDKYHQSCAELHKHLDALFQQLILTNTLRLPWLYRSYELKG